MKLEKLLARLKPQEGPAESQNLTPAAGPSLIEPSAFLAMIEMMRGQGKYDWADETLRGIYDTVAERRTVTEAQQKAIYNIRHADCGSCRRRRGLAAYDDYEGED